MDRCRPPRRVARCVAGRLLIAGLPMSSSAAIAGMALGSWMSGAIFDLTGSYWQAFANGLAWNLLNIAIALVLLRRARTRQLAAG